jgi:7-cyano-7-deazaguanine synthase in queuosine biosynthesis
VFEKAIILLSGGLDSATVLAVAKKQGYDCYAMSINYHQRHNAELAAARKIADFFNVVDFKVVELDLSWLEKNSCYFDDSIKKNEFLGLFLQNSENYNKYFKNWVEQINETIENINGAYFLASDITPIRNFHSFLGLESKAWK